MSTPVETAEPVADNRPTPTACCRRRARTVCNLALCCGHSNLVRVRPGLALTWRNKEIYGALMSTVPFFGLVALPLTLVVIANEIDLSFRR